jgi:hypothetical protein
VPGPNSCLYRKWKRGRRRKNFKSFKLLNMQHVWKVGLWHMTKVKIKSLQCFTPCNKVMLWNVKINCMHF